jgi:hypothetical protein
MRAAGARERTRHGAANRPAAAMLDSTVDSVNSVLKWARANLQGRPVARRRARPGACTRLTRRAGPRDRVRPRLRLRQIYLRRPGGGIRHGTGLDVVTLTGGQICAITRFDSSVLSSFGLPPAPPGR